MKVFISLLFLISLAGFQPSQQTLILTGRVLDGDLYPIQLAWVVTLENKPLVQTDQEGRFRLEIPSDLPALRVQYIGYHPTVVDLGRNCEKIEVILRNDILYHYRATRKVERMERKEIKKLVGLYQQAYETGLFEQGGPCGVVIE